MIKPSKLQAGDKIATISPSWGGASIYKAQYARGKKQLETEFGVSVVEMAHTCANANFIYNNPRARAQDLMDAFADPSIKGIIATIGGDDSIRMLPHIDYDVIRQNPKIFMGYSDSNITNLLCYKAGLVSFSGPSIMAGFGEHGGLHDYLINSVRQMLFSSNAVGIIQPNQEGWTVAKSDWGNLSLHEKRRPLNPSTGWQYVQGKKEASGHLLGGCLEVLAMAVGTEIWPDKNKWDGAILFLETSEEAPPASQLLYFMRNLGAQGLLDNIKGVLLGRPGGDTLDPAKDFSAYDAALLKGLAEFGRSNIPVVTNMDFGHTDPMMVIPYGIQCSIDPEKKQIRFLEPAVQ